MDKFMSWLSELVKTLPRYALVVLLLGILVISGILTYAPDDALRILRLDSVAAIPEVRSFSPLFFWAACILLIITIAALVVVSIYGRNVVTRKEITSVADLLPQLKSLTKPEKAVLRAYVQRKVGSQFFKHIDDVVQSLIDKGVLHIESTPTRQHPTWVVNIEDRTYDYLDKHRELIT